MNGNTWIELDLKTLRSNLSSIRRGLSRASEPVLMVKADAYGHGMVEVSRQAWQQGIRRFAVVHLHEALVLHKFLPRARILLVGVLQPENAGIAARAGITAMIVSLEHGRALATSAAAAGTRLQAHAKIDTGMGRLGIDFRTAEGVITELCALKGINITGLCSHFASSEDLTGDFADLQAARFTSVANAVGKNTGRKFFKHISNSGAILRTGKWDFEGVRPGILMYGYATPVTGRRSRGIATRPFLHWKTTVVQVKTVAAGSPISYNSTFVTKKRTKIATINAGYSDGISRMLSNRGCVLIGGRRCPIAGRVTMNLVAVDAGINSGVREGDEAVLLGTQGRQSIWADEIAEICGTIPYEVLTSIRTADRRVM